ncbi:universal stress protein [Vibrio mediterranei]|uniref:universal stress protein n=1 Tax=Vibrio mediterranei TaxID=689 RepID=UPI0009ED9D29|nr:universal stress protein [Vibrio mediterranei]
MMIYQTVLVAVDVEKTDAELIKHAVEIAKVFNADIYLAYVYPDKSHSFFSLASWSQTYRDYYRRHKIDECSQDLAFIRSAYPIDKAHILTRGGQVVTELKQIVEGINADLLIIGGHTRKAHLGAHLEQRIKTETPLDVLVVDYR